ncbi:MAG: hypothetical protein KDA41_01830, partial [Planctomycetales bacterium]|nr:hypothetical protein [Planctomycetales bacterium]
MTTQRRTATTQTARAKAKSRSARNETAATAAAVTSPEAAALPAGEKAVLKVFRTYLMTPR